MKDEQVREGMMITIDYTIVTSSQDGEKCEAPPATGSFVYGVDAQYRSVETALNKKRAGDRIRVHVPPEEIFGKHDANLVRKLPRFDYKQQRLKEGRMYRQIRKRSLVQFMVMKILDDFIIADFNDPKAGTSADFEIMIRDVRPATRVETMPSCNFN